MEDYLRTNDYLSCQHISILQIFILLQKFDFSLCIIDTEKMLLNFRAKNLTYQKWQLETKL